jgi:hypothetical protein
MTLMRSCSTIFAPYIYAYIFALSGKIPKDMQGVELSVQERMTRVWKYSTRPWKYGINMYNE